jgi:hypothetical protein
MTAAICAIQVQAPRPALDGLNVAGATEETLEAIREGHSSRGPQSGRAARTGRAVASAGPVGRPVAPAGLRLGGVLP